MDVACGNAGQSRLYENSGLGVFTDTTATAMPANAGYTMAIARGDVDSDGDIDIVLANGGNQQDRLFINDGSGLFTDRTAVEMPWYPETRSRFGSKSYADRLNGG